MLMQVHFMRSVKRIAQKVTKAQLGRRVFTMLGYAILDAEKDTDINTLFSIMEGEIPITAACQFFPDSSLLKDYTPSHSQDEWRVCSNWVAWWKRPAHLSKLFKIGY